MSDQEIEARLRADMAELLALFERVGVGWAKKLRAELSEPELDPYRITGWFGTMGSLSDVMVLVANGHRVTAEQEPAVNAEVDRLTSEIYDLAQEMKPRRSAKT
jgi:hypothetical protein